MKRQFIHTEEVQELEEVAFSGHEMETVEAQAEVLPESFPGRQFRAPLEQPQEPSPRGPKWHLCVNENCQGYGSVATGDGDPQACGLCRRPMRFIQQGLPPMGYPRMDNHVPEVQESMRGNVRFGWRPPS